MSLLLFDSPQDSRPSREIELDPRLNRTGDVWHVQVKDVGAGACYLYRVDGPTEPEKGHRFNRDTLLLDPYVKAVTGSFTWNAAPETCRPRAIVVSDEFDWQGDRPLARPLRYSAIYETHVRSLTLSPTSGVASPGHLPRRRRRRSPTSRTWASRRWSCCPCRSSTSWRTPA